MKPNVGRYTFSRHCNQIHRDENEQIWLFNDNGKCTKLGFAASQLVPLLISGASFDELLSDAAERARCQKSEIKAMLSGLLRKLMDEEYIELTFKTVPKSVHNIEHISTNEISNTSVNISVIAWILLSTLGNTLLIGGLNILQQPVFEPFSLAITFSLLILWICGHEYSHYLAAKYVGFKQVTFGIIKRKLFYTVATQIPPQIGINHPGKRSVVSVAGMIYDGLFLSTLTLISLLYADAKWVSLINAVLLMGALSLCLNASVMKGSDGSNAVHHLFNLVGKQRNKLLRWTLSAAKTFMLVNTLFLVVYLVLLIIKSDTILIQVQEHWPL